MNILIKGFEMPYYLDQLILIKDQICPYSHQQWAPSNTTHLIKDREDAYWCFEVEGKKIYCLGLFKAEGVYSGTAPRNDFHDVTPFLKNVFFGDRS